MSNVSKNLNASTLIISVQLKNKPTAKKTCHLNLKNPIDSNFNFQYLDYSVLECPFLILYF